MSLTPASDIVGKKPGRRLTGLLLVAIPVLLVCWMVIWPILSAIWRTVWIKNDGGTGSSFSLETYRFFFTDQYSLNNLTVTLWTTGVCAVLLLIICLPIAIYLRFSTGKLAAYVQGLAIFPMFVPSIILILIMSSFMAFAVSRFSFKFNVALLLLFTAGNLLPAQVIFQPLFQMFKAMPWPDVLSDTDKGSLLGTKIAVIIVHVAFQTGFCTFVLSNYMKTIPKELTEAALVDGASVPRIFFQVVMPLCRPALAALATLEFTWLYNDFFWAVVLLNKGDQRPITSSIANLGGQFYSNDNLIAAASMIVALPTLIVYLMLQRQFISGLTLGANKG